MVPREDGSESRRNRDRLAGDGPLSIPTTDPLPRLEKSGDVAQWSRELVTRLEKNLGTLSLPQSTIVLTNGGNNNVNLQKGLLVRITGPTAPFNITGIGNGTTGQVIILENDSGQPLVLNNENASSQITNRINTGSGTDVTVNGSALLVYLQTRWRVVAAGSTISAGGTVTSVALTMPGEFSVSGSPVTTAGTLAVTKANESANTVWAGPTTGAAAQPTFRGLVTADIPPLPYVTNVAQTVPVEFTISGSPITSSGTLAIGKATEVATTFWAGPISGADAQPTFRKIEFTDLPIFTRGVPMGWIATQGPVGALSNMILSGRAEAGGSIGVDASGVPWRTYTTTTTVSTVAGITSTTHQDARMDVSSVHDFFIATGPASTDIQNMRIWVTLASVNASGGTRNADTQAVDWIGLLASSGLSANWQAYAGNNATNTTTDTLVPYASNTAYHVRFTMKLTSIDFYVNGTTVNISTHLPTTGPFSGQLVIWNNSGGTARAVRFLLYTTSWPAVGVSPY